MSVGGLLLVTVLALPHSAGALVTWEPIAVSSSEPHRGTSQGASGLQERSLVRSAFRGWATALAEGGGLAPDDDADAASGVHYEDPLKLSSQTNFVVNAQLTVTNLDQVAEVCTIVDVELARVKIHCNTTTNDLKEWLPKDSERIVNQPESSGMLIASMHNMHGAAVQGSRRDARPDVLALTFSLLGGICMSAYPVPMKAPSVIEANVHPVFFQTYKSFWVFVTGLCFLVSNWLRGQNPVFNFSWLGVLSAAFWIPAGVCCITAVPRLGMGLTMTLLAGTAATMSFLVFWLVLGESMKVHHVGSSIHYYMAPLYLIGVIFFMALLVAVPSFEPPGKKHPPVADEPPADGGPSQGAGTRQTEKAKEGERKFNTVLDRVVGFSAAFMAGACCTIQFGVVNVAKRYVLGSCADSPHECPPSMVERFDIFGSWMASFGIGALGISLAAVLAVWAIETSKGEALSSFQWKVMWLPGNLAGIFWAAGNVFQLAALTRGGSAVMMPFNQGCSLMLTGLWGLLYYKEVKGLYLSVLWFAVAGCLVLAIVLLSHEKEG